MQELMTSQIFCLTASIAAYWVGSALHKKLGTPLANPLLIATVLLGTLYTLAGVPATAFYEGAGFLNFLLLPATAALGLAIYRNLDTIRKNLIPVIGGCAVGAATALVSVLLLSKAFGLDRILTISLAPKSITTAIATSITEQYGGIVPVTAFAVIVTGIFGGVMAPVLVKLFRIKDASEAGLAIGACSHAVGTATAVKMGEAEGAMGGVAIGVCGVFTVIFTLGLPYFLDLLGIL